MSEAESVPQWERRVRAPSFSTFSLLGPPAVWADDRDVIALLSNVSGRVEVHAGGVSSGEALTQLTDRPDGTTGVRISPDGDSVFWFDDVGGSELGRWVRRPTHGGTNHTLLPELSTSYGFGGLVALRDGTVVIGRVIDDGFEIGVERADGTVSVAFALAETAGLVDVSDDGQRALIQVADDNDWLHPGAAVVDLSTGLVVARRATAGVTHDPVGFRPGSADDVLVTVEVGDRATPAVWNLTSGEVDAVTCGLTGDVTASWYPDGKALLLSELLDARTRLHRLDLPAGALTTLSRDLGVVHASSARLDGSVHALVSRSDQPPHVVEITAGGVRDVLGPPATPPATVRATDVHASGPEGRVHALLYVPDEQPTPHPTVFFVHGGPTGQDLDSWSDLVAALVDEGYAVVRVNYRGSTGYGAQWRDALHRRLGFIELEDITAVRDQLERDGRVDPGRVSIAGGSWGGFLTLMALGTQPTRWRSGVALVPLADWATSVEDEPPFMLAYDEALFGGSIDELPDEYRASSPLTYADDVVAPVFITAGENDPRCPVRQVDVYVKALQERGHDVHYDRLEGGHAMPDVDVKVTEMRGLLEFLRRTNPTTTRST
jgi:acetyl esterase/lipase